MPIVLLGPDINSAGVGIGIGAGGGDVDVDGGLEGMGEEDGESPDSGRWRAGDGDRDGDWRTVEEEEVRV